MVRQWHDNLCNANYDDHFEDICNDEDHCDDLCNDDEDFDNLCNDQHYCDDLCNGDKDCYDLCNDEDECLDWKDHDNLLTMTIMNMMNMTMGMVWTLRMMTIVMTT